MLRLGKIKKLTEEELGLVGPTNCDIVRFLRRYQGKAFLFKQVRSHYHLNTGDKTIAVDPSHIEFIDTSLAKSLYND